MPLPVGTVVAGYRIEGVLGTGGMGTVYLARHRTLPRNDALKILSPELSADREFRARFIREADLAATLNHPNIVTVHDRGETDDGMLWIAMEFVDGTAANSDEADEEMTAMRAVHIIGEVAKGLDHVHSRNLIHRDVKPGNFLLSGPPGAQERVLLGDFGIARALDDVAGLTTSGSLLLTAAYAAPEVIDGEPADQRADVYSLGCSLFRLLTGHTPYGQFRGLAAVLKAHAFQPVPRVSDEDPTLPSAVDDVFEQALAKDPADRYSSAGELAAAAAAAFADHDPGRIAKRGAETTLTWSAPAPPPEKSEATAPPRSTALQATAATATPTAESQPDASDGVPPVEQPPAGGRLRRRRSYVLGALAFVVLLVAGMTAALAGHRKPHIPAYEPIALEGEFGAVELHRRPEAIVTLGPGDTDAVLSLGAQPVVMADPGGVLPEWLQPKANDAGQVVPSVDSSVIAATKPDLIIDTGNIDKMTYDKLTAIAPTLTRPSDAARGWRWQDQLNWIAKALGYPASARELINTASIAQAKIRTEHPAFVGKTITVLRYSDTAMTVPLQGSPTANYLEGIGFAYNRHFRQGPTDATEVTVQLPQSIYPIEDTDVLIVIRTDKAAHGGGFAGLPAAFNVYPGILVIIDAPEIIAALDTGGATANTYLDTALVSLLAQQVT